MPARHSNRVTMARLHCTLSPARARHSHNEDAKFIPFMNTRCKLPAKLEKDHEWLVAHMDKIAATFAALGKLSAADLAPLWAEYDSKMRAHLLEEEEVGISDRVCLVGQRSITGRRCITRQRG